MMRVGVVAFVILGTITLAVSFGVAVRTRLFRYAAASTFGGMLVYTGIGTAYAEMPAYYIGYYFGFLSAFGVALVVFERITARVGWRSAVVLHRALWDIDNKPIWSGVAWCYIGLQLAPLLIPEMRLGDLLAPPPPQAFTITAERQMEPVGVLRVIQYLRILMTPLFYIALYRYRTRVVRLVVLVTVVLYLEYVANAYIGRGAVFTSLGVIAIGLWMHKPRWRARIALIGLALLPTLAVGAHVYAAARIGSTVVDAHPLKAAQAILRSETSFPVRAGQKVIESGVRVDLGDYLMWIVTLPWPKMVTGEVPGARVNAEMSEIVLGVEPGHTRFYGVMPGLVAEGIYIYGGLFFWVHAMLLGAIVALVVNLVSGPGQIAFLQAYVLMIIGYQMNRGGVGSVLPVLVNEFMGLYAFIGLLLFIWYSPNNPLRRHRYRGLPHWDVGTMPPAVTRKY